MTLKITNVRAELIPIAITSYNLVWRLCSITRVRHSSFAELDSRARNNPMWKYGFDNSQQICLSHLK